MLLVEDLSALLAKLRKNIIFLLKKMFVKFSDFLKESDFWRFLKILGFFFVYIFQFFVFFNEYFGILGGIFSIFFAFFRIFEIFGYFGFFGNRLDFFFWIFWIKKKVSMVTTKCY